MNTIQYGYVDIHGQKNGGVDTGGFYAAYKLQSPSELRTSNCGVCWDQVELEREFCKECGIEHHTYYMEMDNEECASHTFLFFQLEGLWYWFEHSWYDYQGIHRISSPDSGLKMVAEEMEKFYPGYSVTTSNEYERPTYGIGCQEFLNWVRRR